MKYELKACPFCGKSEPVHLRNNLWKLDDESHIQYQVVCSINRDGCGSASGWRNREEVVVQLWNSRVENKIWAPSDEKKRNSEFDFSVFDLDSFF